MAGAGVSRAGTMGYATTAATARGAIVSPVQWLSRAHGREDARPRDHDATIRPRQIPNAAQLDAGGPILRDDRSPSRGAPRVPGLAHPGFCTEHPNLDPARRRRSRRVAMPEWAKIAPPRARSPPPATPGTRPGSRRAGRLSTFVSAPSRPRGARLFSSPTCRRALAPLGPPRAGSPRRGLPRRERPRRPRRLRHR